MAGSGKFRRRALWAAAILAALYIYFAALHPERAVPAHPYFSMPGPWAIAHRGGRGLWPENTLFAFEQAAAMGVDVLEMDLRVTADGAFVVIHDGSVDRTTDGTGRVSSMTLSEIRALDAGYRFRNDAGEFPYRARGIGIPVFEEVLARTGSKPLNVEMKSFTPEQAVKLCSVLRRHNAAGRVLMASLDQSAIGAFREACPETPTAVTLREGLLFYALGKAHLLSLYPANANAIETPARLGSWTIPADTLVDLGKRLGIHVQVFTVNDEAQMERLLADGVQGILTDYPDRLLRVMRRE